MYQAYHLCALPLEARRELLELELQTVVIHYVSAGTWTQVFHKTTKYSLSYLFSLYFLSFEFQKSHSKYFLIQPTLFLSV